MADLSIEEMEARVAEHHAQVRAEKEAERLEELAPLHDLVNSPAYAEVMEKAEALWGRYGSEGVLATHLNPLGRFMREVLNNADLPPAEVPAPPAAPPVA